jgi:nucleoid-associated protein YgaU
MSENKVPSNIAKDNLVLIVGGIVVLALVFASYSYFNRTKPALNQAGSGGPENISSSQTERNNTGSQKSSSNSILGSTSTTSAESSVWIANNYNKGDISGSSYTVKKGDTLWEIAEAVYGDGFQWTKILNANSKDIGFLPSGRQALIVPGQVLVIP